MSRPKKSRRYTVPAERTELIIPPRQVLGTFDVAQTTRENRKHWDGADALSARASMSPGVRRVIRIRSRYEAANNSWYSGILRTVVNHIVGGDGPRLQVLTDNPEVNTRLERAFTGWAKRIQFASMLRTMVEAYWRDGEVFAVKSEIPRYYPLSLDLTILETEQIASPLTGSILTSQYVDDGVRFDGNTNELSYHVLDHHPGGNVAYVGAGGKWRPACEVLHLYRSERPGQVRGLPRATPALQLLPIMRRHELAALFAAETAANFAMYLESNSPAIDPTRSPQDFAEIEIARNMLTTLPAGWKMGQIDPKNPGPNYSQVQDYTLLSFGRCTNLPAPLLRGTGEKSNFSSMKGDIRNQWQPEVWAEQNRIEGCVIEPVFGWFLDQVAYRLPGLLYGLPTIADIPHKWHWPPLPNIDPGDTANTNAIRLATGQATLTQIYNESGMEWGAEAERGSIDWGVDVATYKRALFFKTFGLDPSQAVQQPQGQPAALPQGEYTQIGQRAFSNNLKRIRSTLDQLISGEMSRVMAEQTLQSIGLTPERIRALIEDALDGQINDPQLQEVPA